MILYCICAWPLFEFCGVVFLFKTQIRKEKGVGGFNFRNGDQCSTCTGNQKGSTRDTGLCWFRCVVPYAQLGTYLLSRMLEFTWGY